jgi:hypothetical protein
MGIDEEILKKIEEEKKKYAILYRNKEEALKKIDEEIEMARQIYPPEIFNKRRAELEKVKYNIKYGWHTKNMAECTLEEIRHFEAMMVGGSSLESLVRAVVRSIEDVAREENLKED